MVSAGTDVVERGPDLTNARVPDALQASPGEPVGGELHRRRVGVGASGPGAGLPIDHGPAAVGIGKHRVHSPAHHDRSDGHVERHLDLVRRPSPPTDSPRRRAATPRSRRRRRSRRLRRATRRRRAAPAPTIAARATCGRRCHDGRAGPAWPAAGRRSRRASSSGSRRSSTSCDTDSCAGNTTSMARRRRHRARTRRAAGRRHGATPAARSCRSATSPGRTSDRRAAALDGFARPFRTAARTSSAPASTSARRSPRGSTGQIASRAAVRRGLTAPSGGYEPFVRPRPGRESRRGRPRAGAAPWRCPRRSRRRAASTGPG